MLPVTRKRKTTSFQDLCARLTELETQQAAVRRALEERMTLASGRVDFTTTLNSLRGGYVSIVEALSEQLPDVFRTEVLPKLDLRATLNLAQVSMSFRDAVWSVDGVRSMKAKMKRKGRLLLGCPSISNPCENPMYYAAAHGNLTAVEAILCSGEDVNQPTTDKADTALHLAAYYDHIALVKLLIEAGADVDKKTRTGSTALSVAAEHGHTSCVMALLRAGADINLEGRTPIYLAAEFGHEACVALLIGAGADFHKRADDGNTPIIFSGNGHNMVVRGNTPMVIASRKGHTRIVKLLKDAQAFDL
jgi:hypothetical protein